MTTTPVSCSCGKVEFEAAGKPILTAVCYCDDCQKGSRQIGELPNAGQAVGDDGGTAYVLYRRDRFKCLKGAELLLELRLKDNSPTKRLVAACCNSAMYLDFEKGHWLSVYRERFKEAVPPIQARLQTRFKPNSKPLPGDVPAYRSYPPSFIAKILFARIAMLFS